MEETFNNISAERKEYELLLDKGLSFSVNINKEIKEKKFKKGLLSYLPLYVIRQEEKEETFEIKQPVLKVLDRLSSEFLDLDFDLSKFEGEDFRCEALKEVHKKSETLARIVAISVLGLQYQDTEKLEKYTGIFYSYLTPDKLLKISSYIIALNNLVDFTGSIRLLAGNRTAIPAIPDLIEESKKD